MGCSKMGEPAQEETFFYHITGGIHSVLFIPALVTKLEALLRAEYLLQRNPPDVPDE